MPRIKVRAKEQRPARAPEFDQLDELDKLLVRRQVSDPAPGPELESAPGYTAAAWLLSPPGRAWARRQR
jgi:hypothetical protein